MTDFRFDFPAQPIDAAVPIPGSKSITNRALILAAIADGTSVLRNILLADDTCVMIEALRALGFAITVDQEGCAAEISGGHGQIPAETADLYCGNSGTTIRFCTALAALGRGGTYRLDGVARMRHRPVGALADALQSLSAGIEYHDQPGFPPLTVHAQGLRGGHIFFDAPQSSQFVSALLMVAPYAASDVMIEVGPDAPSVPFLKMTEKLMAQFGVFVVADGLDARGTHSTIRLIVEASQHYLGRALDIEPDATNAMYFLAIPAVMGGRITVPKLGTESIQGDIAFLEILERMGCTVDRQPTQMAVSRADQGPLGAVDVDLGSMPDLAPTLAVLALFADGPTTIRNVANLKIKESDRLEALRDELTKLGAAVEMLPAGLRITPPKSPTPAPIETYDDHRMAMSFALAGLRCPGLLINNIECTAKTFPAFFDRFSALVGPRP